MQNKKLGSLHSRLYVLVDGTLSPSQQAVQAGHAVAAACLGGAPWQNRTLVYLRVRDLKELKKWRQKLGPRAFPFYEPWYDNTLTAIAVVGEKEEFEGLPLMST